MEMILPTTPESYWQLLRRSLRLYRAGVRKVMLLALLMSLTAFIPRILSYAIGEDVLNTVPLFSWSQLWMGIINIVSFFFFIGIIWHMHCVIINKNEPLKEDFSVGLKKIISVFIAATLEGMIVLAMVAIIVLSQQLIALEHSSESLRHSDWLWFFCLLFMGEFLLLIYVATLFIFIVPLIAIENKSILVSLRRSMSLVWNHWWRVLSLQMTPWLCYAILLSFLRYLLKIDVHIYFVDASRHTIVITAIQIIIFAMFIPWFASTLLVQLKDLELRKKI